MSERSTPADEQTAAIAARFGVSTPNLAALRQDVIADYSADEWGLSRFSAIEDITDRAVASDLVVSSLEGANTSLIALAVRHDQFERLLGPNGRTMPGPESTVDDYLQLVELDICATDCFRAVGSVLDCLAATTALVTGAPLKVQRAEGTWFFRRPDEKKRSSEPRDQATAWDSVADAVRDQGDEPAQSWLAWALEMRNAVIHRGQLLRVWLNRPSRRPRGVPPLLVKTKMDPAYLVRIEPHMRRMPWLPDMHSLTAGPRVADLWLPEPTQCTLRYLRDGTVRVVETAAQKLLETLHLDTAGWAWPAAAWDLARRDDGWRIEMAAQFKGFEPSYPTPPPSQLRLHRDSAVRAELAQKLLRSRDL
ncbi:MAG TPA: hypothetical protein VGM33_26705 [Baekduia sp.]